MPKVTVVNAGNKLNLDEIFGANIKHNHYGEKGHFSLKYDSLIKLAANPRVYQDTILYDYYGFGGWTAEGVGRVENSGPEVYGPEAYLVEHGVYLTRRNEPDETAYVIEIGHELTIAGTTYKVETHPYRGLELKPLN